MCNVGIFWCTRFWDTSFEAELLENRIAMNLLYVQVGGSLDCFICVVGSPHYPPDYCCRLSLVALLDCAHLISSCT